VAQAFWGRSCTGSLALPDISADNIRDLVILAMMGIGSPDACFVEPYPAVDITFEREVSGFSTCASNLGKIDGQLTAFAPADPTTVSLGATALSCEDATQDITVLDCTPTFSGPQP